MRQLLIITLLISGLFISNVYSQMTIPRMVIQEVYDYLGSYPDNIVYPEEGSIKFRAWITDRPDYILTDELPTCLADMQAEIFTIRFNLGNFPGLAGAPVDWKHGETVRIEVLHTPTGRIAETEFIIEEGSSPIFRLNEEAIALQNAPQEESKEIPELSE
ncbi:MAG: hypothetical protein K0B81_01375 [Candidatus Cloacimonetes bacterium]|nr:hypothetical protein [Candidatus Cloacimonadota bacterium]